MSIWSCWRPSIVRTLKQVGTFIQDTTAKSPNSLRDLRARRLMSICPRHLQTVRKLRGLSHTAQRVLGEGPNSVKLTLMPKLLIEANFYSMLYVSVYGEERCYCQHHTTCLCLCASQIESETCFTSEIHTGKTRTRKCKRGARTHVAGRGALPQVLVHLDVGTKLVCQIL